MKKYPVVKLNEIHIIGRCSKLKDSLALFWTASGIEVNVKAAELSVEINAGYSSLEPWISIHINDVETSRMMLNMGTNRICVFRGMNKDIVKNVKIYKETQAMSGDPEHSLFVKNLFTDGSFEPVRQKDRRIEFIGDSITSGEGAIGSKNETDWISMFFGGTKTYAFRTGRRFDADFRMISQSGWGVLCGYDNNPYSSIPRYYQNVCGLLKGSLNEKAGALAEHDFESWKPDLIVINLATNDQGAFFNPEWKDEKTGQSFKMHLKDDGTPDEKDAALFKKAVFNFLNKLRGLNPDSTFLWIYGMMGNLLENALKEAIDYYQNVTGDKKINFRMMPNIRPETTGALSHPDLQAHEEASQTLCSYIKEIMNW